MSKNDTFETEQLTDAVYLILLSLVEIRHGYAIMQFINDATNGEVSMGPGTLYTLLKKLNKANLIEQKAITTDRKKQYEITKEGKELLNKEINRRLMMVNLGLKIMKEVGQNNG